LTDIINNVTFSDGFLFKIAIAMVAAIILGIDREYKMKGIGVKTIVIIFLSSTVLTHLSLMISFDLSATQQRVMDPGRIPSYILSSIGFLGAGVILHKTNNVIAGLTTAAMTWAAAGIGILIGFGYYAEGLFVSIVIVASVNIIPYIIKIIGPEQLRMRKIKMTIIFSGDTNSLIKHLKEGQLKLGHIHIKDSKEIEDGHKLTLIALVDEKRYVTDVYEHIKKYENVDTLAIESMQ
jgi:putative Mg2+ transporter-C (MgtC) family protein